MAAIAGGARGSLRSGGSRPIGSANLPPKVLSPQEELMARIQRGPSLKKVERSEDPKPASSAPSPGISVQLKKTEVPESPKRSEPTPQISVALKKTETRVGGTPSIPEPAREGSNPFIQLRKTGGPGSPSPAGSS